MDISVSLQYLRARYYDPSTKRFIQQDTVWGKINVALSQNLYAYVQNSPLNFYDPSGHYAQTVLTSDLIEINPDPYAEIGKIKQKGSPPSWRDFYNKDSYISKMMGEVMRNVMRLMCGTPELSKTLIATGTDSTGAWLALKPIIDWIQNAASKIDLVQSMSIEASFGKGHASISDAYGVSWDFRGNILFEWNAPSISAGIDSSGVSLTKTHTYIFAPDVNRLGVSMNLGGSFDFPAGPLNVSVGGDVIFVTDAEETLKSYWGISFSSGVAAGPGWDAHLGIDLPAQGSWQVNIFDEYNKFYMNEKRKEKPLAA